MSTRTSWRTATITEETIEVICQSLRVNPSWAAAADYAGRPQRTVNDWKNRGAQFAARLEGDESVADLPTRRLYARGREAWEAHDWPLACKRIEALMDRLERDPERVYYDFYARTMAARARGELELVGQLRKIAVSREAKDADVIKAVSLLLRSGWPDRYSERMAVAEVVADAAEEALADAEIRARAAIEAVMERRARESSG